MRILQPPQNMERFNNKTRKGHNFDQSLAPAGPSGRDSEFGSTVTAAQGAATATVLSRPCLNLPVTQCSELFRVIPVRVLDGRLGPDPVRYDNHPIWHFGLRT